MKRPIALDGEGLEIDLVCRGLGGGAGALRGRGLGSRRQCFGPSLARATGQDQKAGQRPGETHEVEDARAAHSKIPATAVVVVAGVEAPVATALAAVWTVAAAAGAAVETMLMPVGVTTA